GLRLFRFALRTASMSNAICVQDQCQSFLMYNKKSGGVEMPSDEFDFVPIFKEVCKGDDGYVVTYYNLDGTAYEDDIEAEVIPDDLDVHQQVMCNGTTTFIRWYVALHGEFLLFHDTDLAGEAIEAGAGPFTVGDCASMTEKTCQNHLLYNKIPV